MTTREYEAYLHIDTDPDGTEHAVIEVPDMHEQAYEQHGAKESSVHEEQATGVIVTPGT